MESTVNVTTRNKDKSQHARCGKWIDKGNFGVTKKRLKIFRKLSEQALRVFSCSKKFFLAKPIRWPKN